MFSSDEWMDGWTDGRTDERTKFCCGEENNWKEVGEEKNESRKKSKRKKEPSATRVTEPGQAMA